MKKELLKPKYDVVFQALFQGNKDNITESLISDIIGEKIQIIEIKTESSLNRKYPSSKAGRLDLRARLKNGNICQIEIQLIDNQNTIKRLLYYWSRTYSEQLKRGDEYKELKKTIGIIITNYELEELKDIEELDTKWQITDNKTGKNILTKDLELHIIELPKAKRILEKDEKNRIAQWMEFIDNPNTEKVEKIVKENKEVEKAKSVLYVMSEDEELERRAFLEEKWERDELSMKNYHRRLGNDIEEWKKFIKNAKKFKKNVDKMQREFEQNKEKIAKEQEELKNEQEELKSGQEDLKSGQEKLKKEKEKLKKEKEEINKKQEEINKKQEKIVKNMKKNNIDIQLISKITGLTENEIQKILDSE